MGEDAVFGRIYAAIGPLLKVQGDKLETRPIAGTRPGGMMRKKMPP
jgi:hypothetical protein